MKLLKLYYFPNLISSRLSPSQLLFPFFGPTLKRTTPFVSAAFKKINYDRRYLVLVDRLDDCDCILLPNNYWMTKKYESELIKQYVQKSKSSGKKILIDAYGDSTEQIVIPNSIVLRTSVYRNTKRDNEIIIPAPVEDLLVDYFGGKPQIRKWQPVPGVGFTGWGKPTWRTVFQTWLERQLVSLHSNSSGLVLRQSILDFLEHNGGLNTNFIRRDSYSGHINTVHGNIKKIRREFVENIISNDYTVCVRGAGNYSYRFYETLSLGRIPLILDTDIVLPLEDKINYSNFCVSVKLSELEKVGDILLNFHKKLSAKEFLKKQNLSRNAFYNFLRLDHFTSFLVDKIKVRIAQKY